MDKEKESFQGMEHESQHLHRVCRTILFVLNMFKPMGSLAWARFRARWLFCRMYSVTALLLIPPREREAGMAQDV